MQCICYEQHVTTSMVLAEVHTFSPDAEELLLRGPKGSPRMGKFGAASISPGKGNYFPQQNWIIGYVSYI